MTVVENTQSDRRKTIAQLIFLTHRERIETNVCANAASLTQLKRLNRHALTQDFKTHLMSRPNKITTTYRLHCKKPQFILTKSERSFTIPKTSKFSI